MLDHLNQSQLKTGNTSKQFKLGDIREDGFVFSSYKPNGWEYWLSPETFHIARIKKAVIQAKYRSEKKKVPFGIDADYLIKIYPKDGKCPIFGIDFVWAGDKNTSPSLDRIHPALGYVKGNVMWISGYANTLKSSNSLDTLRTLLAFYEKLERKIE